MDMSILIWKCVCLWIRESQDCSVNYARACLWMKENEDAIVFSKCILWVKLNVFNKKKGDGSFENYQNEKTGLFCVKYKTIWKIVS